MVNKDAYLFLSALEYLQFKNNLKIFRKFYVLWLINNKIIKSFSQRAMPINLYKIVSWVSNSKKSVKKYRYF